MTTTVQRLLDDKGALLFPGVHDALSAKIAEQAGFEMAFVTGYGASASQLGKPDMGFLNQSDLCDIVSRLSQATPIPLIADADTGYGNALNVEHTIRRLIHAGAKGCFLEDQQWPKRCGHMSGKQIINRDEYIDKIRAAVAARNGKDFFIVARTDALAVVGMEEAQARMAEARTAGADGFFIEAPADEAQLRHIAATAAQTAGRQHDSRRKNTAASAYRPARYRLRPGPIPAGGALRHRPRARRHLPPAARRRISRRPTHRRFRHLQQPHRRGRVVGKGPAMAMMTGGNG